jgi:flagellar biosynthesis protein
MPDKNDPFSAADQPRLSAVALSHKNPDQPPVVIAKGYGDVAEAIIRTAKESGLYVHRSPELVKLLINVNLDSKIPPSLYLAVAEMLNWLQELEDENSS